MLMLNCEFWEIFNVVRTSPLTHLDESSMVENHLVLEVLDLKDINLTLHVNFLLGFTGSS